MNNIYQCVNCSAKIDFEANNKTNLQCSSCGFEYKVDNKFIGYDFDTLLKKNYHRAWLLWKALNNNGELAYRYLIDTSLSVPDREDVKSFGNFISKYINKGSLIDIGCGLLELPGYLEFSKKFDINLYGLDPIGSSEFIGTRIHGCSEFLPIADETFDMVVFATSMDHVCSLSATLAESKRVLKRGGYVVIWMGDTTLSFKQRLSLIKHKILKALKTGYRSLRYYEYPGNIVFYSPPGAIDPFHSYYDSPGLVKKEMKRAGFNFIEMLNNGKNEIFLCFTK